MCLILSHTQHTHTQHTHTHTHTHQGAHATTTGDLAHPPGHTLANASHPSVTPLFRQVRNNFILGTYNTLFGLDTDDGSGYLQAYDNFFVYGGGGLKAFFGGRWQHHFRNVYAYIGDCFWTGVDVAFYDNYCVAQFVTHSPTRSPRLPTHSFTRSLAHLPTHPLTHSLTYSPTHSLTHSPTHALTHSLTHSLTQADSTRSTRQSTEANVVQFDDPAHITWLARETTDTDKSVISVRGVAFAPQATSQDEFRNVRYFGIIL